MSLKMLVRSFLATWFLLHTRSFQSFYKKHDIFVDFGKKYFLQFLQDLESTWAYWLDQYRSRLIGPLVTSNISIVWEEIPIFHIFHIFFIFFQYWRSDWDSALVVSKISIVWEESSTFFKWKGYTLHRFCIFCCKRNTVVVRYHRQAIWV